jgi:hypothetical protein
VRVEEIGEKGDRMTTFLNRKNSTDVAP